jgi:carotenoid cleavage dioxygenase
MNQPVWTSDDPHLSGSFAPIQAEIDTADLPPASGAIPPGLDGVNMRNGPNPRFKPLSYTYPFDGDGMIHALALPGGRALYCNRLVGEAVFVPDTGRDAEDGGWLAL